MKRFAVSVMAGVFFIAFIAMPAYAATGGSVAPENPNSTQLTASLIDAFSSLVKILTQLASTNKVAAASTPQLVSVSPASGTGMSSAFALTYSDASGVSDLNDVNMLINTDIDGAGACWVDYNVPSKTVSLASDDTSVWSSGAIGSAETLSNSQCSINLAAVAASVNGDDLTVNVPVAFTSAFAGTKNVYLRASNVEGSVADYTDLGIWTVGPGVTGPQLVSITPSSGSGMSATLSLAYSDSAGASDLNDLNMLMNTAVDGTNGCWVDYNVQTKAISLASNDTTNWSTGSVGSGSLSNSQCSLNLSGVTVAASGGTLILKLPLTFTSSFTGTKNIYLRASSVGGAVADYTSLGTWNVVTGTSPALSTTPTTTSTVSNTILTGVHWPSPSDFASLKNSLHSDFAIVTVDPTDTVTLQAYLAAAKNTGIKLIIGAYPVPYTLNSDGTTWTISSAGVSFLNTLAANASLVKAVFVFNEPYWTNPDGSQTYSCGNFSAAQLRSLRSKIQSVWSGAKIYQDIGDPTAWIPGGSAWSSCIGDKYADQTGIADYVGIWYYPFSSDGYLKTQGLQAASSLSQFVLNNMSPAVPVFLAQSFACSSAGCAGDGGAAVMPTASQMQDWNCSLRSTLPSNSLISWYVWQQGLYSDYLMNHPELWGDTNSSVCTASAPSPSPTPIPAPDTTPPSIPTNVVAAAGFSSQVNVSWAASTDAVGVAGYTVYRNGTKIATVAGISYTDANVAAGGTYTYQISAFDAAGNNSGLSASASVTIPVPTTIPAPTVTFTSPVNGATLKGAFSKISITADSASGVSSIYLYIDNNLTAAFVAVPTQSASLSYRWNLKSVASGVHTLKATANDSAGNIGSQIITVHK